ncbi:MAG: NAD(P)-dependent oxidoreductase [Bacteroidota bacterium]
MKILITGSSGHLGEALVRVLKNSEHEVVGIDLVPSNYTDAVGSIDDRAFVKKHMQGVDVVLHPATLHKPHVVTHTKQDFVDTNITGTLHLLEEALLAGVRSFVFTSTTSTFGDALNTPAKAVWVTEELVPSPKNIYGATKIAAENLCQIFHRNHQLPCLILRTSRFFPEEDDKKELRENYSNENIKVNEFLHRRVDVADIVNAHLLAMEKAPEIGFGKYIISATSPFMENDLVDLKRNAPAVVEKYFPDFQKIYAAKNWKMFPRIGRVYVNEKARMELGWEPKYDFKYILNCLSANKDFRSPLAQAIGAKGYHEEEFEEGPYPV